MIESATSAAEQRPIDPGRSATFSRPPATSFCERVSHESLRLVRASRSPTERSGARAGFPMRHLSNDFFCLDKHLRQPPPIRETAK